MSRGKYSPFLKEVSDYIYNAKGELPAPWKGGSEYDAETMFDNYDKDGYDSYGYSAYDSEGKFVGIGDGVDRAGYTESEYLCMSDDEYYSVKFSYSCTHPSKGRVVTIESIYNKVRTGALSLASFEALVMLK